MVPVPLRNAMNEWLFMSVDGGGRFVEPVRLHRTKTARRPGHDTQPQPIERPLPQGHHAFPLGVSSNFRYWGEDKTIYVAGAKGARVRDIDGNEYSTTGWPTDPASSAMPTRASTRPPATDRIGGVFALSTEREYAVAEATLRMVPAAELVRFSNPAPRPSWPLAPRACLHRQGPT